jgi:Zn-dependent protease with chaperone function
MLIRAGAVLIALLCAAALTQPAYGQAPARSIPAAATGEHINVEAATDAYLALMPPAQKARSDAYFEGGYWIDFWTALFNAVMFLALLQLGVSAWLRDGASRIARRRTLQVALYAIGFVLSTYVLSYPLSAYVGFFREHQYGLATQSFGGWMGDQLKGLAISLVITPVALIALYAVLRRAPRTWWLWGAVVTIAMLLFVVAIAPVYISPIFNKYTRLEPGPLRDDILRLAHANGIRAEEVYEVDASRQTTRVSANVSGMFGTERITLNDNLLNRASPAAIQAVMGHEMGHYVLNHVNKMLLAFGVLIAIGFGIVAWAFDRLAHRHHARWRVAGIADPAGLPLIALLFSVYLYLLTPVINSIIRTNEYEADVFGLNAARQPDGFAEAALLLSDYRKMSPGPIEELLFFDHPSGHTRIFTAMRWKAYRLKTED